MSPTALGCLIIHVLGRAPTAKVSTERLRSGDLRVHVEWSTPHGPAGVGTKLAPASSVDDAARFAELVGDHYLRTYARGPTVTLLGIERTSHERDITPDPGPQTPNQ